MQIKNIDQAIDFIKTRRKELGMSRDKLAAQSGVIKQSIEKIEKGKRIPRVDTYIKLVNALGCVVVIK